MTEIRDNNNLSKAVFDTMIKVPREIFVPVDKLSMSNMNRPLEVANGQTISQPSLMAYMIELLELDKYDRKYVRILEIGTCSGYNAVLMQNILNMNNYRSYDIDTVEIIKKLVSISIKNIKNYGYISRRQDVDINDKISLKHTFQIAKEKYINIDSKF